MYFTTFVYFSKWYVFCYSPALTAALRDLATQIPQLKKDIQDGLLKNLSLVLMGRQLKHPGAPKGPPSPLSPSGELKKFLFACDDCPVVTLYCLVLSVMNCRFVDIFMKCCVFIGDVKIVYVCNTVESFIFVGLKFRGFEISDKLVGI